MIVEDLLTIREGVSNALEYNQIFEDTNFFEVNSRFGTLKVSLIDTGGAPQRLNTIWVSRKSLGEVLWKMIEKVKKVAANQGILSELQRCEFEEFKGTARRAMLKRNRAEDTSECLCAGPLPSHFLNLIITVGQKSAWELCGSLAPSEC